MFRSHNYREGEAAALDSLGYIAHRTGHYSHVVDCYQQALTLFRDLGSTFQEADTRANLAEAHHMLGQHEQARAAWPQALRLYQAQHRTADVSASSGSWLPSTSP